MLIGDFAKLANMSKDGIRHYEQLGLIKSAPRRAGQRTYREYDAVELETIDKVRQLQQLGFSLKEIGPLFDAYAAVSPFPKELMVEFLEARLVVIREKLDEIKAAEAFICRKLDGYRADLASRLSAACVA